ncbi:Caspase-1 precursor, putative [Pediculus humanus corporis]|uniref:Caspase-1, putative n=1 Tax=Pediculus humanus subsp. corporis TaxID=121224 RepID=E0VI79_PEDHC|nr:Caspase-1 precursor, putative [Pediculus humanus corporis]EEB13085.1 Caspase-1 precursor, putative [Pediculus humanus corporis]
MSQHILPPGNGDQVDVFGFKKPNYDNKLVAHMPSERDDMFYNMTHKRRGLAVIFNHENFEIDKLRSRTGTLIDAKNLERVLTNLGFEVVLYHDLKTRKVMEEVQKAANYNHKDSDCFFLAVLSHGEMGILYGKDCPYKPEQLWLPFTADKCPSLAGKPKMFFFQACQGDQLDSGITLVKRTETDGHVSYKIPIHADFLIAYSTIPGYYSWRNTTKGSWFIQALCMELENYADKLDLLSLLTMVCRRVAFDFESNTPNDRTMHQQKQIPCITTMLTRLIRFEPKSYQMDIM